MFRIFFKIRFFQNQVFVSQKQKQVTAKNYNFDFWNSTTSKPKELALAWNHFFVCLLKEITWRWNCSNQAFIKVLTSLERFFSPEVVNFDTLWVTLYYNRVTKKYNFWKPCSSFTVTSWPYSNRFSRSKVVDLL